MTMELEWVPYNKSGTEWRANVSYGHFAVKKANNGKWTVVTVKLMPGIIMTGMASIEEAALTVQELVGWYQ